MIKKTLLTLTAAVSLTIAAHAQSLGDVMGGLRKCAEQVGDQYAGMFGGCGPDNPVVVQAIKSCAIMYGYKKAAQIAQFVSIAQEEMRKEQGELDQVQ
jgi:hypothetical protein